MRKSAKKAVKKSKPAKAKRPAKMVRLVRKVLSRAEEAKVHALLATVYKRAAEELSKLEKTAGTEVKRMKALAKKYKK